MDWLITLFQSPDSVAHTVLVISIVAALGLAFGSIRIFGISLGIGGVLFSGLLFGHFKITINHEIMEFVREFGLILFVYSIGLQVGPGFFASLRRQGMKLNIMAAGIVIMGVVITVLLNYFSGIPREIAVGLFSGATTNTPSLAASQQALKDLWAGNPNAQEIAKLPGLGYAVAYPFGIIGIILTMILVRFFFKIDPLHEAEEFKQLQSKSASLLAVYNIEVKNPNLEGLVIEKIPSLEDSSVVISRILHEGKVEVAQPDTVIHIGDILLAVGPREDLDEIKLVVGELSKVDLKALPSSIITKRILVTKKSILGKTIDELECLDKYDVNITRISRADIEFSPNADFTFQFGDTVLAVGLEENIKKVAAELGNSLRQLNHPEIIPVLVGIALGVILGSYPMYFPGMPAPVKLGLAGGPLVVAILLSRLGRIGPLVWYMPISANFMLRELGIVLFLTCVGLMSGDKFVATLVQGSGLYWMACAALITFVPILIIALIARFFFKTNYLTICGLLAGSMTDPPALAFATGIVPHSDAPNISYATVYPLVMLLRVLSAQIMVLFILR